MVICDNCKDVNKPGKPVSLLFGFRKPPSPSTSNMCSTSSLASLSLRGDERFDLCDVCGAKMASDIKAVLYKYSEGRWGQPNE